MAVKIKKETVKELKLTKTPLVWTGIFIVLMYTAYFYNFPNLLYGLITLGFSIMLIKNFKTLKGFELLFYYLILGLLVLPLVFLNYPPKYFAMLLGGNILVYLLMIYGLMKFKKWGFWLNLIILILSLANLAFVLSINLKLFFDNTTGIIIFAKNIMVILFSVLSVAYLIKHRKTFG